MREATSPATGAPPAPVGDMSASPPRPDATTTPAGMAGAVVGQEPDQPATRSSWETSPSIARGPPVWLTEILRGFASSATGIVRVSTPSE